VLLDQLADAPHQPPPIRRVHPSPRGIVVKRRARRTMSSACPWATSVSVSSVVGLIVARSGAKRHLPSRRRSTVDAVSGRSCLPGAPRIRQPPWSVSYLRASLRRVYHAIDALTARGFALPVATVASSSGPHRTVLRIAPPGRRSLPTWLAAPVEHVRSLLLLKLLSLPCRLIRSEPRWFGSSTRTTSPQTYISG